MRYFYLILILLTSCSHSSRKPNSESHSGIKITESTDFTVNDEAKKLIHGDGARQLYSQGSKTSRLPFVYGKDWYHERKNGTALCVARKPIDVDREMILKSSQRPLPKNLVYIRSERDSRSLHVVTLTVCDPTFFEQIEQQ